LRGYFKVHLANFSHSRVVVKRHVGLGAGEYFEDGATLGRCEWKTVHFHGVVGLDGGSGSDEGKHSFEAKLDVVVRIHSTKSTFNIVGEKKR
jgi:hypothetical protein